MTTSTTGLDSAPLIPIGSTITSARWAVPADYDSGPEFDHLDEALAHAIDVRQQQVDRHAADPRNREVPHPEWVAVDLRWRIEHPAEAGGGSTDVVARRTRYETLAEARELLSRLRRADIRPPGRLTHVKK